MKDLTSYEWVIKFAQLIMRINNTIRLPTKISITIIIYINFISSIVKSEKLKHTSSKTKLFLMSRIFSEGLFIIHFLKLIILRKPVSLAFF